MDKKETFWIPLDNAAKIFPAVRNEEFTTVMRLSATLTEPVTIKNLFNAVELAEKRFPYFKVSLKRGFFWYYLEQTDTLVEIKIDDGIPCRAFSKKDRKSLLYRILVFRNKISVEFSHILTDGHGLITFFKALILYYFKDKGLLHDDQIDNFFKIKFDKEEYEDAYSKYFKANIPNVVRQPKAFHLPYPLKSKSRFDLLFAIIALPDIKKKAKEKEVSITTYLIAAYLMILQEIYFECVKNNHRVKNKIARIQVPVNLRNIYQTKTMRNFSLFVMPEIDFRLGEYTFDEVLKIVHFKMKLETDEKLISKIISRNVGSEKKLMIRGIPIWLKSLILYLKYYSEGTNQYSGVVTNIGKFELPETISDKIDYLAITPPPPNKKLKVNCGVISYNDKLVLSFGNITKSKEFERKYLTFIAKQGIKVKITK